MPDPIAVYAAAVGTLAGLGTASQAIWTVWVRDRPRLKVTGSRGVIAQDPVLDAVGPFRHGQKIIMVEAVNTGTRPITIQEAGIVLKNDQRLVFIGTGRDVPKEVGSGQFFSTYADPTSLTDAFRESPPAYPYCRDAQGKRFRGHFDAHFRHWLEVERIQEDDELSALPGVGRVGPSVGVGPGSGAEDGADG
jgi:hypothetical protein